MEYPIIEWKIITNNQILITVNNTPLLNELDKINNRNLFVYFNSTNSPYDNIGVTPLMTYKGMDSNQRYFIIDGYIGLPRTSGEIIIKNLLSLDDQKKDNISSDISEILKPVDNNLPKDLPSEQNIKSVPEEHKKVESKKIKKSMIFFSVLIIILVILFFLKIKYF